MEAVFEWFQEKQVERTIKALGKNNISASFAKDRKTAKEKISSMIPDGSTVGIGGSVTLNQLGLIDLLKARGLTIFNPFEKPPAGRENVDMRKGALISDVFLTGTNAVTEDGQLFNIDATGNRAAAMFFGPKKVIVIAGANKIVKNLEEARAKVQEKTAPINSKRLKRKTPCVQTGKCEDCDSPERICNIEVVIRKKPRLTDFEVVLIGEPLGI
jgi:L-lactate utilization protein LutB